MTFRALMICLVLSFLAVGCGDDGLGNSDADGNNSNDETFGELSDDKQQDLCEKFIEVLNASSRVVCGAEQGLKNDAGEFLAECEDPFAVCEEDAFGFGAESCEDIFADGDDCSGALIEACLNEMQALSEAQIGNVEEACSLAGDEEAQQAALGEEPDLIESCVRLNESECGFSLGGDL